VAIGARPRLVALRALGLGDLLTAAPALRALARAYADHDRALAAPATLAPLVALVEPGTRLVPVGELEPLPAELHGADTAVNLHGRGPQSHRLLLEAAPARCLWFHNDEVPESRGAPRWRPGEHETRRWCRMLAEHRIPAEPGDLDIAAPPGPPPQAAVGATLLHPGAASAARRWPAERFAAVARAERDAGRQVVLTGGDEEVELARFVARHAGLDPGCVLAGRTDLAGLARAVAAAARVLCGDTGVAHLATALGTPSVVLFGPTAPTEWGPPPERPWHRVLWRGPAAGGGDPHGEAPDPALLALEPRDAIAALEELPPPLTRVPGARRTRAAPPGRRARRTGARSGPSRGPSPRAAGRRSAR
jgi:ADP-heptose:LPS heptosyltransferase